LKLPFFYPSLVLDLRVHVFGGGKT
jgi:hypothetical protein